MDKKKYDSIIIGAGLSGLSCAYNLLKQNKKILIIEKEPVIGGRAHSIKKNGFILESGAVYIVFAGKSLRKHIEELKLNEDLVKIDKKVSYFYDKKLHNLDFSNPFTLINSFLKSKLISSSKKINPKTLLFLIKCNNAFGDIRKNYKNFSKYNTMSAEKWALKYFDLQTVDNIFEPIAETFLFANLKHVSASIFMILIGAFLNLDNHIFYLKNGIGSIAERFYNRIYKSNVKLLTRTTVKKIEKKTDFIVYCSNRKKFFGKTIISSIPLTDLEKICKDANIKNDFKEIEYVPMICDNVALNKPLDNIKDNHLVFLKAKGHSNIVFVGEATKKHGNVAPKGKGLLYIAFSPSHAKKMLKLSEKQIEKIVDKELMNLFQDYKEKKLFHKVFKWEKAFALTSIDYFNNYKTMTKLDGLFVCGDCLYVGLDGVIESGEIAAKIALDYLTNKSTPRDV